MPKQKPQRAPSMQFYFRQFAGDEQVLLMDLDAVGAHVLLMCAAGASQEGYRIPNDPAAIRNVLRNPKTPDFRRIITQLKRGSWKVSDDGLWLEQDGMRRTLLKQKQFSKLQSERAKRKPEPSRIQAETQPDSSRIEAGTQPSFESAFELASEEKNLNLKNKPAATPPSDDSRLVQCRDFAFETFTEKRGHPPTWMKGDYKQLADKVAQTHFTFLEFKKRWQNFLESTEPWVVSKGGSLKWFCSEFDSFSDGPRLQKSISGGKLSGNALTQHNATVLDRH